MPPVNQENTHPLYWQSLEEYANTDEFKAFVEAEFPTEAELLRPGTRRRFLQLMAASLSLAGLKACRWPKETIVPYANRPDGLTPGVPRHYATSMEVAGTATGLLATSYDGRPIKIEGNPSDPNSQGATNAWAQAAILELYDPERGRYPARRENQQVIQKTRDDLTAFIREHFSALKSANGRGLRFLSEASSSATLRHMRAKIKAAFPESKWFEYEPLDNSAPFEAARLAFGRGVHVSFDLEKAKIIASLDADLLGVDAGSVRNSKGFAKGRDPESGMNRLYCVESHFCVTGGMADHRLPLRAGDIEDFAMALAAELVINQPLSLGQEYQELKNALTPHLQHRFDGNFVKALAKDLAEHPGEGLIAAGARQTPLTIALCHLMNTVLRNTGEDKPVRLTAEDPDTVNQLESIRELCEEIESGAVDTLVILGGNPCYDAPADLDFAGKLASVPHSVHLSLYVNETSAQCAWYVPRAHFLESWGDARGADWTHCVVQPLIAPLYDGLTPAELLAEIADHPSKRGYDLTREAMKNLYQPGDFETFWRRFLHEGVTADRDHPAVSPRPDLAGVLEAVRRAGTGGAADSDNGIEITFVPDPGVYDGRFANNAWLQELPDFLTKIAWDNAAMVGPALADELGVRQDDLIEIELNGAKLEIAAHIMPGQPPRSIALPLGYGRTAAGAVGNGAGFDAYVLRTSNAMYAASGAAVAKTGKTHPLAATQDHFRIDKLGMDERQNRIKEFIREGSLDQFREKPDFAQHVGHAAVHAPLWKQFEYDGHKWGMSIDLNACTGCNACVVACQSENNIPVVGKEQVLKGREMHWIRIDRYFKGEPDAPEVAHQPMACVHCENAPCEQVCPVAATVHDNEGLNVMVYNRCIGTRYCSNNCPFKVRRFNFFNYHKDLQEMEKLGHNPDVTVRSRGVMEKCTYCVQRIQSAKIKAKNERRPIADGEIRTACQQVCPASAIAFGDLNDPDGQVAKMHGNPRNYTLLDTLFIKPRTVYLARLRNPNPELVDTANDSGKHPHHS